MEHEGSQKQNLTQNKDTNFILQIRPPIHT